MQKQHLAWSIAAGLHLALAVCGAAGVTIPEGTVPGSLLSQYGGVSGADSTYGFFAPAVASQCRTVLTMRDGRGHEWQDALFPDVGTAFGLRVATILDSFVQLPDTIQRGIAGSWAGVMLGRHTGAEEVVVGVEIELLPTMAEWRAGQRRSWKSVYQATFVRARSPVAAADESPVPTPAGAR